MSGLVQCSQLLAKNYHHVAGIGPLLWAAAQEAWQCKMLGPRRLCCKTVCNSSLGVRQLPLWAEAALGLLSTCARVLSHGVGLECEIQTHLEPEFPPL